MTEFAQFVALKHETDNAFRLTDSNNNRDFRFDLPGLDATRTVIIMFKVAISGNRRLTMMVNENVELSIDFSLNPPPGLDAARSWHEIMGPNEGLKASNNRLHVAMEGATAAGTAITVSDIVFLYHVNTELPVA